MMMMQQMQQMQQMMAMQQQQQQQQPPGGMRAAPQAVMAGVNRSGVAATSSFSFLDVGAQPPSKQKKDKSFDFIQNTIQSEKKK